MLSQEIDMDDEWEIPTSPGRSEPTVADWLTWARLQLPERVWGKILTSYRKTPSSRWILWRVPLN